MGKNRLSLCVITQDDDENDLEEFLQESRRYVDEIIIADLSVSEQLFERAEKYGACVFRLAWNNDRSEVKNFCIDQAHGKWIIFLQPNERISEKHWEKLHELLDNPNAEGYLISIDQRASSVRIYSPVQSLRLLRNRKEYRYRYRSYESIPDDRITNVLNAQILIRRLKDESEFYDRADSILLLLEEMRKYPDSSYLQYIYGIELLNQNKYEHSIRYFQSARKKVNLDSMFAPHLYKCLAWSCISVENDSDAFEVLGEGIQNYPYYLDLFVLRAELLKRCGKYEESIQDLEASLRISKIPNSKAHGSEIGVSVILQTMGEIYDQLSDGQKAIVCYQQALEYDQDNYPLRITLMDALYGQHEYRSVLDHLEYLESILGNEQADSIRYSCYMMLGEPEKARHALDSVKEGTPLYANLLLQQIEDDWIHDRWVESKDQLMKLDLNQDVDPQVKALYHFLPGILTGKENPPPILQFEEMEIIRALLEKLLWFQQPDKARRLLPLLLNQESEVLFPAITALQLIISSLELIDSLEEWTKKMRKRVDDTVSEYDVRRMAAVNRKKDLILFYDCFVGRERKKKGGEEDREMAFSISEMQCEIGRRYDSLNKSREGLTSYFRTLQWDPLNCFAQNKIMDWFQKKPDQAKDVIKEICRIPEGLWLQTDEELFRYLSESIHLKKVDDKRLLSRVKDAMEKELDTPESLALAVCFKKRIGDRFTEVNKRFPSIEWLQHQRKRVNLLK